MSRSAQPEPRDEQARRAAARRAFIRSSHPDVGGDPAAFVAGLARFDGRSDDRSGEAAVPGARPAVHRSRRPDRIAVRTLRDLRRRLRGVPPRRLK